MPEADSELGEAADPREGRECHVGAAPVLADMATRRVLVGGVADKDLLSSARGQEMNGGYTGSVYRVTRSWSTVQV
jgi:hypothetical protein